MMNFENSKMIFSNYGHPPPYLCHSNGSQMLSLKAQTTFLGVSGEHDLYEETVNFEKGDAVFLFTDGLMESTAPSGEFFGLTRIEQFLKKYGCDPGLDAAMLKHLEEFNEGNTKDDILILTVKTKR